MSTRIPALTAITACLLGAAVCANADSTLLFPYVNTYQRTYTFLSLYHNPYAGGGSGGGQVRLSGFLTRPGQYPGNCGEEDIGQMTITRPGTIVQWELTPHFNLPDDFGDHNREPQGWHRPPSGQQGYLIASYTGAGQLYGEATVIDTATGMTLSYSALHAPRANAGLGSFGGTRFVSSWLPRPVVGTTWYALPLNPAAGDINLTVVTDPANPGAYGRNGQYQAVPPQTVALRCAGVLGLEDLMPGHDFSAGGWFSLNTTGAAMIWKIQQSGELGIPAAAMNPIKIVR